MDLHLTLIEILALTALFILVALFSMIPYSLDSDKKRNLGFNFTLFVILIITIGSMYYKNTKENLIEGFYNNQELLCKEESEKKIIISQAKGYTLQSDYFIHEQNILYIGGCILLEDTNQTKK